MAEPQDTVPRHRLDEESNKRKTAEAELKKLQGEQETLSTQVEELQRKLSEADSDYKSRYEAEKQRADKEKKKREEAEQERDAEKKNTRLEKQRSTFMSAAGGVVRDDAISDAFSMLDAETLEGMEPSDNEAFTKAAQQLAESKPYLAPSRNGSGAGGSDKTFTFENQDPEKPQPIPFGRGRGHLG